MSWEDDVAKWVQEPVTQAFFADIKHDIANLALLLVEKSEMVEIYRIQGMLRALQGVVDTPEVDGIPNPYKGDLNA